MSERARLLPSGLLALVPHVERTRVRRRQLHLGAVRHRGQQGPGGHVRQPGQPHRHADLPTLRRRRARGRSAGADRGGSWPSGCVRGWPSTSGTWTTWSSARRQGRCGRCGPRGNVYLETREPWKTVKVDRERTAVHAAHRDPAGRADRRGQRTLGAGRRSRAPGGVPRAGRLDGAPGHLARRCAARGRRPAHRSTGPAVPEAGTRAARRVGGTLRRPGGPGVSRLAALAGKQAVRVVLLLAILGLSGTFLGLAAGYPISRIQFEDSDAVRLDQSQLAGQIDPVQAVVTAADLPIGWQPGDPALSAFRTARCRVLRRAGGPPAGAVRRGRRGVLQSGRLVVPHLTGRPTRPLAERPRLPRRRRGGGRLVRPVLPLRARRLQGRGRHRGGCG